MSEELTFAGFDLSRDRFTDWQKSVTYEKKRFPDQDSDEAVQRREEAKALQEKLIEAVDAGPEATKNYLYEVLQISDSLSGRPAVPRLPNPLTPGEMSRLPIQAERRIAEALGGDLKPAHAAEPAVWALCHAVWMGDRMFGEDLPKVFLDGGRANTSEARARNFLRRTGGIRHVRGNTSPLVDCPISAAWWRFHIVKQITVTARDAGEVLDVNAVHKALWHKEIWSNLVTMSLRRVTSVCSPRARAAAVVALDSYGVSTKQKMVRAQIQGSVRSLGRLSYSHSLESVEWQRLVDTALAGIEAGVGGLRATEESEDSDEDQEADDDEVAPARVDSAVAGIEAGLEDFSTSAESESSDEDKLANDDADAPAQVSTSVAGTEDGQVDFGAARESNDEGGNEQREDDEQAKTEQTDGGRQAIRRRRRFFRRQGRHKG